MFKKLKESWAQAKADVEAEQKAKKHVEPAKAPVKPAANANPLRAANMPAQAQEFMRKCATTGLVLDGTPNTLPVLDQFVGRARTLIEKAFAEKDPEAQGLFDLNTIWVGAYLGEVIRLNTGGSWVDANGMPAVDLGEPRINTLMVAAHLLQSGAAQINGVDITTSGECLELMAQAQLAWLARIVKGPYESIDALKTAMTTDGEMARWLLLQSQIAVQTAKLKWRESLDFSPDSLKGLERILGTMHDANRQAAPEQRATEEQIDAAVKVWGVYAGEVFRRHYGGQWVLDQSTLTLVIAGATIFPLSKVRKRMVDGDADNVAFFFHAFGKIHDGKGNFKPPA